MVIAPVKKGTAHYEVVGIRKHVYRYGYKPIDDENVSAVIEESRIRLAEPVIRSKVETYCKQNGLPNEYVASDYGY